MNFKKVNDDLWINTDTISQIQMNTYKNIKKDENGHIVKDENGVIQQDDIISYTLMINNKFITLSNDEFSYLGITLD